MVFNPKADSILEIGDTVIAVGRLEDLKKLGAVLS